MSFLFAIPAAFLILWAVNITQSDPLADSATPRLAKFFILMIGFGILTSGIICAHFI